ncbi:uncharacterized protein LACBIDRAFT_328990 [Laccaria bicolor S238N-H82]|uniref:Predicted protein n=1 Tax=Laccaria bicolor (strain S238N-H82 / ATCC MYA-4686) TaxID=486041 RepID=B0DGP5_LACBS|nr:uncharacterized protein LACBIDRAFT_328990 [Laccaria bicolor S238N-H82]EDR06305.1 predicted protein [Laccaria bicolor S238N-H82]|eukprot:XP_001883166.1 predicted protein [Laccaria bicolor S238N-H82]
MYTCHYTVENAYLFTTDSTGIKRKATPPFGPQVSKRAQILVINPIASLVKLQPRHNHKSLPLPPSLSTTSCLSTVSSSTPTPNTYAWRSLEGVEHCQQLHHTNQPRTRTRCHVDTLLTNLNIMVDVPSPVTSGSLACKLPTSTYDVYGLPANVYIPSLDYFTPHVANMSLTACRHVTSTTSQRRGHMGESIMIAGKGAIGGDVARMVSWEWAGPDTSIPASLEPDPY